MCVCLFNFIDNILIFKVCKKGLYFLFKYLLVPVENFDKWPLLDLLCGNILFLNSSKRQRLIYKSSK